MPKFIPSCDMFVKETMLFSSSPSSSSSSSSAIVSLIPALYRISPILLLLQLLPSLFPWPETKTVFDKRGIDDGPSTILGCSLCERCGCIEDCWTNKSLLRFDTERQKWRTEADHHLRRYYPTLSCSHPDLHF